ncbi:MAG: hypothetical protein E3J35_11605 [Methanomassiliicoccales archaeon]|nr:MAG: hypothetical protein E3J35_11605 [Methanomassiliicoccales archaeon]
MKIELKRTDQVGVTVVGGGAVNALGVVRCFGRRGIAVAFVDSDCDHPALYSRSVHTRLVCPDPDESETQFVDFLRDFAENSRTRYMIVPLGDAEVRVISKHKGELQQSYLISLPSFEVIKKLVNKKEFYKMLAQMGVQHPTTYFPEDISELESIGKEINYPYIVKPAYTIPFRKRFRTKCFQIGCYQDLTGAIEKLRDTNLEVVVQEIIPGTDIYMCSTYFDKRSNPIAVCGYDKLRQYPPDFGSGSLCRSNWRKTPIELALSILKEIGYQGIAYVEFKKDPWDGEYKLLEINARTSLQNRLPARCGADLEYIAYLDAIGQYEGSSVQPEEGIVWIDEIGDLLSCLVQLKDGRLRVRDALAPLRGRKVYAISAWDDPIPSLVHLSNLSSALLRLLWDRLTTSTRTMMAR